MGTAGGLRLNAIKIRHLFNESGVLVLLKYLKTVRFSEILVDALGSLCRCFRERGPQEGGGITQA